MSLGLNCKCYLDDTAIRMLPIKTYLHDDNMMLLVYTFLKDVPTWKILIWIDVTYKNYMSLLFLAAL